MQDADEVPFIHWLGTSSLLRDQADGEADRSAIREAVEFLSEYLRHAPRKVPEIFKAARAAGIAEKTLRRAKSVGPFTARKLDFDEGWVWESPNMANGADEHGQ
jgi:hypothetical protein